MNKYVYKYVYIHVMYYINYIYDYVNICKYIETHTKSRSINLHWAGHLMFHQWHRTKHNPREIHLLHASQLGFQVCCDISTAEVKTKMVQENRHIRHVFGDLQNFQPFLPERMGRKVFGWILEATIVVSCLTALHESLIVAKVIISRRSARLLHGFDPKMASHGMSPRHRDSCVKGHGNRHFNALKETWMHWSQHVESPVLANC